ncbi:hypothetical protein F1188_16740 [Roseospira marina]|uniref:Uncharacterized protein n=1 Tax=Roseospira marina TaxID=140057 RepID=A0A5M6I8S6_9PROT|nr:hypothetical protein F1188_16740 [Roseospira marina]
MARRRTAWPPTAALRRAPRSRPRPPPRSRTRRPRFCARCSATRHGSGRSICRGGIRRDRRSPAARSARP